MDNNTPENKVAKRKATSLFVEEGLWLELKIRALRSGLSLSDAVEQAIRLWMSTHNQEAA